MLRGGSPEVPSSSTCQRKVSAALVAVVRLMCLYQVPRRGWGKRAAEWTKCPEKCQDDELQPFKQSGNFIWRIFTTQIKLHLRHVKLCFHKKPTELMLFPCRSHHCQGKCHHHTCPMVHQQANLASKKALSIAACGYFLHWIHLCFFPRAHDSWRGFGKDDAAAKSGQSLLSSLEVVFGFESQKDSIVQGMLLSNHANVSFFLWIYLNFWIMMLQNVT